MERYNTAQQIATGLICLAVVAFGLGGCTLEVDKSPGSESMKMDAWVMAQQFLEERLKNPSSASYGWQTTGETTKHLGSDKYQVNAWVEATNSFGGTLRKNWAATLQHEGGGNWRLLELSMDE